MQNNLKINGREIDTAAIDEVASIQEMQAEYRNRMEFRKHKIETMKHKLEGSIHTRERKEQTLLFYFLNLSVPIVLTCLNAYILLDLGINSELKGKLIIAFVAAGFLISVVSNLQIAPWREVLKLYFMIDSLIPVLIAGLIGFFSVFNYLSTNEWYELGFEACYPIFVIYFAGSLRVMIAYQKWAKWKVIIYKLAVMSCGLIFFYVGFIYMNGAYKITKGYLPQVEDTVKNMVYLYVFGNCDLFFEYYRRISEFDQTDELRYKYEFKDMSEQRRQKMIKVEMQHFQNEVMVQQIQDRAQVRQATTLKCKKSNFTPLSIDKTNIHLQV